MLYKKYTTIITVEEGKKRRFWHQLEFAAHHQYSISIKVLGIEDVFTEHGTVEELQRSMELIQFLLPKISGLYCELFD